MNFMPTPTESARIDSPGNEIRDPEVQELNELQLSLVGGGNVIINFG